MQGRRLQFGTVDGGRVQSAFNYQHCKLLVNCNKHENRTGCRRSRYTPSEGHRGGWATAAACGVGCGCNPGDSGSSS